ncbi:MAG: hypothetical protein JO345_07615 [Streptosporangiaceae bacterium]|nr:hypothetical protein [Streptosporangiaceae bacterium]
MLAAAVPVDPAMTTLKSVIARLALVVRCAGLAYIAVQMIIWNSFYSADFLRLAAPVAAMGWAAAAAVYLWRGSPPPLFACIDSAVNVAFALGAQGAVPPGIRGHAFSWLAISLSNQLIIPAWYTPASLSVPLALASPVAYWAGAVRIAGAGTRATTATAILLVLVAGVHINGRRQLYRRAAAADAALDRADRAAGEQYVILSRNIERREHERLLHDTILNTLTALARTGSDNVAEVVSRCRQDVALIESTLSDPESAGGRYGDLLDGIQAVAAEMRSRGLDVHVETTGDGTPVVPAPVATAISNAAREALSNVAAHAGTREAWVEISFVAPDDQAPAGLRVIVRDKGAGFDLARVDPARLGLRRSIAERIADQGGHASIWSSPGQGTVVRISWPAPAERGQAAAEPGRSPGWESLP